MHEATFKIEKAQKYKKIFLKRETCLFIELLLAKYICVLLFFLVNFVGL